MASKLHSFPIVGNILKKVDQDVKNLGIQKAAENVLTYSGTKLLNPIDEELMNILSTKRVVIVANHTFDSDTTVIFASLPHREDVYMIANAQYNGLIPSANKYVIPVYITNNYKGEKKKFISQFLEKINPITQYSSDEEHSKNIESIRTASNKLADGGLVIIFPNPGENFLNTKWFNGVGHLLKGVATGDSIYVVNVYIDGTSNLDYLRIYPNIGKILPSITVTFDKPYIANPILDQSPEEITISLERRYKEWAKAYIKPRRNLGRDGGT